VHNNQIDLFATPLWGFLLNTEESRLDGYIRYVHSLSSSQPSQQKSNFGGWQSSDDLHRHSILRPLVDTILTQAKSVLAPYTTTTPGLQSMWANINYRSNYNAHHTHEGWISGVFYLSVPPQSGRLVFTNPAIRSERSVVRAKNYPLNPQRLACILFPSWLEHYVEPSLSDQPRLSISFNIGEE